MSAGPEYKAVKNFVHNTNGIGRNEIREMVRECIKEVVRDELERYFKTKEFQYTIKSAYGGDRYFADFKFSEAVKVETNKVIGQIIANQLDVKVTTKE